MVVFIRRVSDTPRCRGYGTSVRPPPGSLTTAGSPSFVFLSSNSSFAILVRMLSLSLSCLSFALIVCTFERRSDCFGWSIAGCASSFSSSSSFGTAAAASGGEAGVSRRQQAR